jgi:hypothetical protein
MRIGGFGLGVERLTIDVMVDFFRGGKRRRVVRDLAERGRRRMGEAEAEDGRVGIDGCKHGRLRVLQELNAVYCMHRDLCAKQICSKAATWAEGKQGGR